MLCIAPDWFVVEKIRHPRTENKKSEKRVLTGIDYQTGDRLEIKMVSGQLDFLVPWIVIMWFNPWSLTLFSSFVFLSWILGVTEASKKVLYFIGFINMYGQSLLR